jgi:four helix bundle protein
MATILLDKSLHFAIKVVKASQHITQEKKEYVLSKQLVRSGTSITAMVHEAQHAESKRDFIHKMYVALKEANETMCWLKILRGAQIYYNSDLFNEIEEILKMLIAIIKTAKRNLAKQSSL